MKKIIFVLGAAMMMLFFVAGHDAAPSPGNERKPTQTVCAAYRLPSPRGPWPPQAKRR